MCGSSECQRPASLSVTLRSRGAHLGEELLLRQSAVAEQIDLVDQALGRPCPGEQCLWFYVLEGELTIWVEGKTVVAGAGSFVFGPRDVPHTFFVSSEQARFLLVTEPAGFEGFIRALAAPAAAPEIPPAPTAPPDMEPVLRAAADYGLEILGPPGIPA